MKIKPIFEDYAKEFSSKVDKLVFVAVNVSLAKDIAESFEVKSIPTFITYYKQD